MQSLSFVLPRWLYPLSALSAWWIKWYIRNGKCSTFKMLVTHRRVVVVIFALNSTCEPSQGWILWTLQPAGIKIVAVELVGSCVQQVNTLLTKASTSHIDGLVSSWLGYMCIFPWPSLAFKGPNTSLWKVLLQGVVSLTPSVQRIQKF